VAQAYTHKHLGGRNAATFRPEALRALTLDRPEGLAATHAPLQADALGRIVRSNLRTPKVLMDLSKAPPAAAGGGEAGGAGGAGGKDAPGGAAPARSLDQEPLLAARILIEDCLQLLLDVDDIDRLMAAGGAPDDAPSLLARRQQLAAGVVASLNVSDAPEGGASDVVLMRVLALPKGRSLVARTLRVLVPPGGLPAGPDGRRRLPVSTLKLLWALLRNAAPLYGPALGAPAAGGGGAAAAAGAADERRLMETTEALSAAAAELLKRLGDPADLCACLQAFTAGCLEGAAAAEADRPLPLFPAGRAPAGAAPEWLGAVLTALLLRGSELGLEAGGEAPAGARATWSSLFGAFLALLQQHLRLVAELKAGGGAAGASLPAGAAGALACMPLVRVALPHASDAQRTVLRRAAADLY